MVARNPFGKRFWRISVIARKELLDTLRDRRTLIAMVLVPLVLYPALMLGSLQALELQTSRMRQEQFMIGVESDSVQRWLLNRVLGADLSRFSGVEGVAADDLAGVVEAQREAVEERAGRLGREAREEATAEAVEAEPPQFKVVVVEDVAEAVKRGEVQVGVLVEGSELPRVDTGSQTRVTLVMDQTNVRSDQFATPGLRAVFERFAGRMVEYRLSERALTSSFVQPLEIEVESVATPERVGGSVLGQIVPLILIVMTITGAIYPAIDLTAGERERGTLETLMVAPVPTVELIAGKFVVVALIGMLSAALNLLSIGGSIYLGGLGSLLTRGSEVIIPYSALPWVLLLLIPLAVMFSAMLLAVCSFARSFKEAQNYVMPVMLAALIPAVIGTLPGTRLEGPLLLMPVTNIVVLTRDLFLGQFAASNVVWVTLSTCVYAGAAVAVAAKLFGQEAVLFSDSASIKTLFQRRFFKPRNVPAASQALLLLALVYSMNFFLQQWMQGTAGLTGSVRFFYGTAVILIVLMALLPFAVASYTKVRVETAFSVRGPRWPAWFAAVCFGLSTWILATAWAAFQARWLPVPEAYRIASEEMFSWLDGTSLTMIVFLLAIVPAMCEELFFRGYVLNGLRGAFGLRGAMLVSAAAFAINHHSVHRLIITAVLGILLAVLVIRWGSIWPAVVAHAMHNGIAVLASRENGLQPWLERIGYVPDVGSGMPQAAWIFAALLLVIVGLLICAYGQREALPPTEVAPGTVSSGGGPTLEEIP